jgi:transglutaminase-like putative cysteine protease
MEARTVMRWTIRHRTVYHYPRAVVNSVNEVWLRPMSDSRQTCLQFALTTEPPTRPKPYTDYYGNVVYHFDVPDPHEGLVIVAEAEVETVAVDYAAALARDRSPYHALSDDEADLWLDFLEVTALTGRGERVRELARRALAGGSSTAEVLQRLAELVAGAFTYSPGDTRVDTSAQAALELGRGVCQDYTHAFLAAARVLGIPARYVSGYLCSEDAESGQVQQSHAWPEAHLPGAGWVEFDPTNNRLVDERYVRIAVGRDYNDVPPVRGAYAGPSGNGLDVAVYVLASQHDQQQQ